MKDDLSTQLAMTLDEILNLVKQLPLVDKVRLIESVAPEIEQEIRAFQISPRKSLWGLCADLGNAPSEHDIDEVRSLEWADFPREDV
jgi:hypothetical protein